MRELQNLLTSHGWSVRIRNYEWHEWNSAIFLLVVVSILFQVQANDAVEVFVPTYNRPVELNKC